MRRSGSAGVSTFLSVGLSVLLCVQAAINSNSTTFTIAGSCVKKHPQLMEGQLAGKTLRCAAEHCSLQPVTNEICTAAMRNISCSGHGRCSTAACTCDPGWEGERCAEVTPQVLSAGHALAFDGSDDFIFAELHENLIANNAMDNFTLMAWIKPEYQGATALDMHIVGHAAEDGPALGLTKGDDGKRRLKVFTFWSRWEADHCTGTVKLHETVIRGQHWHHVAVTANRNELSTYVDGVLQSHCAFNYTKANWTSVLPGRTVHVGRGDPQLDSANHRQYKGEVDEVRYFRRHMTKEQIDSMRSRALAAGDRTELILHLSFDEDDSAQYPDGCSQPVLSAARHASQANYAGSGYVMSSQNRVPTRSVKDQSPARHVVVLGGTSCIPSLLSRAPRAVQSSAPLADRVLQREIREGEQTTVRLLAVNHSDKRAHILFVPSCGKLLDSNDTELNTTSMPLTLEDDTFTFQPPSNSSGVVFELVATLMSGTQPLPHNITVRILVRPKNRAPIAGSAGGAIECDGIRTYMYNQDFSWPVQNFSHGRGGGAVTVEWWGYVPDDSAGDRAVFSIGNDEVAKDWVNDFNPYRKGGRFFARAPGPKGELSLDVGTYSTTSGDMTAFYNDWAHFAVTHDQTEGQQMAIYINGIELARGTHDFVGVGQIIESVQFEVPEKTKIQSLMLCSWSFWSEVYHKGLIDEFRIWNASKTIDEIRDNMHKPLNGDEPNLVAYYNFDDDPSIDIAIDKTGSSARPRYDLHAGGCATCDEDDDRFKGYMPDTNSLVCQPSAKSADSEYFIDKRVYGASSHCFGEGRERQNTKPQRVPSGARLGGYIDAQTVQYSETAGLSGDGDTLILLNGTDPDENDYDQIQFIITELPAIGKGTLFHVNASDSKPTTAVRVTDTPTKISYSNRRVLYRPPKGDNGEQKGGMNFATFKYKVTDGLLVSQNEAVVHFNIYCPPGRFLSQADSVCKECVPGRYAPQANVETECQMCGRNEYQGKPGQTTCVRCLPQEYCSEGGCADCDKCEIKIDAVDNATTFGHIARIDGSGCEHTLRVNPNKPADDVLIELSNHSTEALRYVITSLPRFGELRHVSESSDGGITSGDNVRKTFETPPTTETEKISLGWRPFSASSMRKVRRVLAFNNSLHLTQVKIYASFAPEVKRASSAPKVEATIEACPDTEDCGDHSEHGWFVLFKPDTTSNDLSASRSSLFSPGFCPTSFKSNRLRIVLDPARVDIQAVIDLAEVQGVQSLDMLPFATLLDGRGRLLYERGEKEKVAPSSEGAVGQVQFPAVSFGFSILQCSTSDPNQGAAVSTGLVVLKFEDSEPVVEPSSNNVLLVTSLAAALVVAAVGIFVQHRRYRAQLAAMRGPSRIGALEFNPHSQLESSVKLLMTLRDDATNDAKRKQLDLCIETLSSSRDVWNVDLNTELENLVDDQQTKAFLLRLNTQNDAARTSSFKLNKRGATRGSELISSSPTNMVQNGKGLTTIEDDSDDTSDTQRTSSCVGGMNPMFVRGSGRVADKSPLQNELASVDSWDFDIHAFVRAANQRPIYHMGIELLRHRHGNLLDRFKIDQEKAMAFLDQMDQGYSKYGCAYHCAAHAADVMQGVHHFMQHAAIKRHINVEHILLTYIAAAMHDYLHPGVNANFLIATNDPLALRYNDEKILESMHLAESFALMKRPQFNIFSHWVDADYRRARGTLIKLVFATDLGQHFNFLGKFKSKIAAAKAPPPASTPHHKPSQQSRTGVRMPRMSSAALLSRRSTALRALSPVQQTAFPADAEDTVLLLQMCMKCSDISHPARSWESHCKWSEYFVEENFKQGERERKAGVPISPLCDPDTFNYPQSQVGFMQFIVEPLYTAFSSFCQESRWDTNLHNNLQRWQAQLAEREASNGSISPVNLATAPPPPPMPGSPGNAFRLSEVPPPPVSTPPGRKSPPPPPPILTPVVSSDGRTQGASANETVCTVRVSPSHQRQHSQV